jgi:dipeptidyl aminopeptidase/acylaminoacyl peptidase
MKLIQIQFLAAFVLLSVTSYGQKKPLTHAVYDSWQSVTARVMSDDGKYVAYTITPQEGDGELVIQSVDGRYRKSIPRGYMQSMTADSRYLAFRIKPVYQQTRQARIKKKRPDEMPKDSIGLVELGKDSVYKSARVKSFKMPEKGGSWVAYSLEKSLSDTSGRSDTTRRRTNPVADSLQKVIDSLNNRINTETPKKKRVVDGVDADWSAEIAYLDADDDPAPGPGGNTPEGTDLILVNFATGKRTRFSYISDYVFDKQGKTLVMAKLPPKRDSLAKQLVIWYDLVKGKADTISKSANDFKNFVFDEEGKQLVYLAERDSSAKAVRKLYKLWYFKPGLDSAVVKASLMTSGMPKGYTVSENAIPFFSKDGKRLFIGTAPIPKPKDTTLVDFELARLDVWSTKDDYLQPQQLKRVDQELKNSYLAVMNNGSDQLIQLGNRYLDNVITADQGNSPLALAMSDSGSRIQTQWTGRSLQTAYLMDLETGNRKMIKDKLPGFFSMSPKGKFVFWYDPTQKNYFSYNTANAEIKNITSAIKTPLFDEDDDHPDFPPPHGFVKWLEDDSFVFIYDKYDIWKVDPSAKSAPVCITGGNGRKTKRIFRNVSFGMDDRTFKPDQTLLFTIFNETDKTNGFRFHQLGQPFDVSESVNKTYPWQASGFVKAKQANVFAYLKGTIDTSANLVAFTMDSSNVTGAKTYIVSNEKRLSNINQQQKDYNWFSAELVSWKMFDGKQSQGLLFKPENFDPKKKYPIIFYFYERMSEDLYMYRAPAPSASTVNIPYFTSNGYLVFIPDIYYKKGQPGEDSYNAVGSAAKFFAAKPWVDSTKMGIQGQSWGGYQVAYLVTRTNMFTAAGAGAPVANMTSAYGGIRWGTGLNRQFQYEKTQSRIGATLWERPDLYIKNSPLFKADKIKTPLLIMHNDADGSVPWYQGVELFTAMKRLGKTAWLLEYNGEDHNLVERRNRKDLSVRLGQFFDYYLKGAKAPKWMIDGVPAVEKGKSWGLEVE